jgi:hypothetical protein
LLEITFRLDVFLFNPTTSELSNYFQPTQNSEEPKVYSLPLIDSETALIIEESLNIYPEIKPGIEYHGDEKDILELLHLILIHPDTLRS